MTKEVKNMKKETIREFLLNHTDMLHQYIHVEVYDFYTGKILVCGRWYEDCVLDYLTSDEYNIYKWYELNEGFNDYVNGGETNTTLELYIAK